VTWTGGRLGGPPPRRRAVSLAPAQGPAGHSCWDPGQAGASHRGRPRSRIAVDTDAGRSDDPVSYGRRRTGYVQPRTGTRTRAIFATTAISGWGRRSYTGPGRTRVRAEDGGDGDQAPSTAGNGCPARRSGPGNRRTPKAQAGPGQPGPAQPGQAQPGQHSRAKAKEAQHRGRPGAQPARAQRPTLSPRPVYSGPPTFFSSPLMSISTPYLCFSLPNQQCSSPLYICNHPYSALCIVP